MHQASVWWMQTAEAEVRTQHFENIGWPVAQGSILGGLGVCMLDCESAEGLVCSGVGEEGKRSRG